MPRPSTLNRRAVLASLPVAVVLLTSACDADDVTPPGQARQDPDQGLLDDVTTATRDLLATATQTQATPAVSSRPTRATAVAALADCLTAHLRELDPGGAIDDSPSASPSPRTSSPGARGQIASLLAAGRSHVTLLTDSASRAESGAFARLLASAGAGLQQHLVALEPRNQSTDPEDDQP